MDYTKIIAIAAQWVIGIGALLIGFRWTPVFVVLPAVPLLAVFTDCSAFGQSIYSPYGFLVRNPVSLGCYGLAIFALSELFS